MMAKLACNLCDTPLTAHCPPTNPHCTWLRCTNKTCPAAVYDWHRGSLRYTDNTVQTWDQAETTDQPPVIEIHDTTDDDG